MGNDSLDELLEDTIQIINIIFRSDVNKFLFEQDVSGEEPSPQIIKTVCSFLGNSLKLMNLSNLKKGDAESCHEMYLKNSNPMGFLIMLSKVLPALECPHTILTTGPVKKRLVTKKAKLLLLNFLASVILLFDDLACKDCEDDAIANEQVTVDCELCGMKMCCYYCSYFGT